MRKWIAAALLLALTNSTQAQETTPGFLDADHWADGTPPTAAYAHLGVRLSPENVAEEFGV